MDDNAFSIYSNVFGIFVGSVSLITLAFGFCMHLPSNRIKHLDALLDETDKIFRSALEEGLLPQQKSESIEDHLSDCRERTMDLRSRVLCVTTWFQDCKELVMGVSADIGKTCYELRKLRAEIITSSEAQRRNLCAIRDATTSTASSPSHVVIAMDSIPMADHTSSNASSIATSELTESTIAEGSDCNDDGESFTTAEDLSDAVPNISAQPTERVSPDWRRIWKHSSKHAINPGLMIMSTKSMDRFQASKLDAWVATTYSACPHHCTGGSYSC
ncbi:hypothetical protein F5I97DRAFT_1860737 [Phlebopus sp. FC_14]|nr:hypothetical protein F5I97DRAFT_1860737 [Phlebopus sp. FC_14]